MNWKSPTVIPSEPRAQELAQQMDLSLLQATLLLQRGLSEADEIRAFLDPDPPLEWPQPDFMPQLLELFGTVAREQGLIMIHGDYDADGLTGTTLLSEYLEGAGFRVEPFLPTRSLGYGLNVTTIEAFAARDCRLLITVDCGISNAAEIAWARELGMAVVITDHHGLGEQLPEADLILHPSVLKIPALETLSGSGMACWLAMLLAPHFPSTAPPEKWLEVAGIGALADMTPLRGLNRALVKHSLRRLRQTTRPGLCALFAHKGLVQSELDEQMLGFQVIPLLNAAGRLQSPMLALELLRCRDSAEAQRRVTELNAINEERKQLGEVVQNEICARLGAQPPPGPLVLADEHWHFGILGILCSRLVELYGRPVVLMRVEQGVGKASVRAPEGFHVLRALQTCADLMLKFGGHAQAGGFSMDMIHLDTFQARLQAFWEAEGQPVLQHTAIRALSPAELTLALWEELQVLAPFGAGNPQPAFLSQALPLTRVKTDKHRKHLLIDVQAGVKATAWNVWQESWQDLRAADLYYTLERNSFRGEVKLNLQIAQFQPCILEATLAQDEPPNRFEDASSERPEPVPFRPQTMTPAQRESADLWPSPAPFKATPAHKNNATPAASPSGVPVPATFSLFRGAQQLKVLPAQVFSGEIHWHDGRGQTRAGDGSELRLFPPAELLEPLPEMPLIGQPGSRLRLHWLPEDPVPLRDLIQRGGIRSVSLEPDLSLLQAPLRLPLLLEVLECLMHTPPHERQARLAKHLALSPNRIEGVLTCLCELGLMTPDQTPARCRPWPQRVDLRESEHYRRFTHARQAVLERQRQWSAQSLEALQAWLQL
jgi:single-stranded-DNA-specific exonuclease